MAENHHNDFKRPHGETGDTVQQAAEVSKPTSDVGRVLDNAEVAQVPPDSTTGSDAMPGRSDAL